MASGMNMEEAKKVAEKMTYREAVMNCLYARCVPYRKATRIKMQELLELAEKQTSKKVVPIESEDETIDMDTGEWYPYTRTDWTCPICGEYETPYDDNFCSNCGQKLDWSEYYDD